MKKGQPLRFVKGHNRTTPEDALVGSVFGRLTVISFAGRSDTGAILWHCLCNCGGESTVHNSALRGGHTRSCGCLRREGLGARHGMARGDKPHSVWLAWSSMRQRCYDPAATNYSFYGGRGIRVCRRWHSFEKFRDDMLPSWFAGGTLERNDNEGNYFPINCRWATKKEQARNRRTTAWVEMYGERMSFAEAVERYGKVGYGIARQRIHRNNWSVHAAITTPPGG